MDSHIDRLYNDYLWMWYELDMGEKFLIFFYFL
jgi:hypothetical protein